MTPESTPAYRASHGEDAEVVTDTNPSDPQVLRCVRCWAGLGPAHRADEAGPAVIVSQGQSLCEAHARSTYDAVWG